MLSLVMTAALMATVKLQAGDTPPANPFFAALSAVSPAELPAKSAELVSQADSKNRVEATANVVKAAVGLNPAAAAAIVGTIAQSTPEMASVAAATAVALMPGQAIAIARAAAVAAPSEAGKIVEAVCRVVPNAYKEVANAVAGVAPGAGKAILAGIYTSIPTLKVPINDVLAGYNGGNPPVGDVLSRLVSVGTATANGVPVTTAQAPGLGGVPMVIAPAVTFGPPYVPIPVSPVNYSSGAGGQVPPGGRPYTPPPPP